MTDFSERCPTCDGTDVSPLGPSGCPDCHEGRVPAPPDVIGLCPGKHMGEFYVPHGGICPECDLPMVEYMRAAP